jgi:ADP-heptose:LPS heptosyltransferase
MVVLHPGASDPRRRWPAERFAQVGDALAHEGYKVLLVGIPDEAGVVERVSERMEMPAQNLCGALTLHALTGVIRRAALVIANDSGPRHLAEAVGTPTVGLFWAGNVINAGSAFRSLHRPLLSWRLECAVCGRNTIHDSCSHSASFVDDIRIEEALEAAFDLLASVGTNRGRIQSDPSYASG